MHLHFLPSCAMGAYVAKTEGDKTTYSYIQIDADDNDVAEVGSKYIYVTFNSIK